METDRIYWDEDVLRIKNEVRRFEEEQRRIAAGEPPFDEEEDEQEEDLDEKE